jgi:hypothetical protein
LSLAKIYATICAMRYIHAKSEGSDFRRRLAWVRGQPHYWGLEIDMR